MTSILTAYLAREILKTSCAVLLILYVILLSNALGTVLADKPFSFSLSPLTFILYPLTFILFLLSFHDFKW